MSDRLGARPGSGLPPQLEDRTGGELRTRRFDLSHPAGHHLYVVEAGRGPSLLLIHGAAGSWANWSAQIRALASRYRVIAPDLRGHGASPWPGPSTVEDFLQDLRQLLPRLDLPPRFVLAGHSFGGYLATRLAAELGEQVAALALLNTAGSLPQGLVFRFLKTFSGGADLVRQHYPWMVSTGSEVARCLTRKTLQGWDCWSLYPSLGMPSLVVLGARDPLIPVRAGREMARRLVRARLEVITGGGHVSMVDSPALVNGWLEELMGEAGLLAGAG